MSARSARERTRSVFRDDRKRLTVVIAAICLLAVPTSANDSEVACTEAPMVVKIHADWCLGCKAIDSVWSQLSEDLGDRITLVELDVTNRTAFVKSKATARRLGLKEFFAKYRSQTGTVAILDCNSLEPVAILAGERELVKYREAIERASHSS